MKQLFVDTSAWGALADRADKDHARALQFRDEIVGKCKLVTSNYILDELYTLLLMNVGLHPTIENPTGPGNQHGVRGNFWRDDPSKNQGPKLQAVSLPNPSQINHPFSSKALRIFSGVMGSSIKLMPMAS